MKLCQVITTKNVNITWNNSMITLGFRSTICQRGRTYNGGLRGSEPPAVPAGRSPGWGQLGDQRGSPEAESYWFIFMQKKGQCYKDLSDEYCRHWRGLGRRYIAFLSRLGSLGSVISSRAGSGAKPRWKTNLFHFKRYKKGQQKHNIAVFNSNLLGHYNGNTVNTLVI